MQLCGNNIVASSSYLLAFSFAGLQFGWGQTPPSFDLLRGHTEIQMDYDEEDGWWAGVSYTINGSFDSPGENELGRISPDSMEFALTALSRETSAGATDFFLPEGIPIWRIPQGQRQGTNFVGLRVLVPNGTFLLGNDELGYRAAGAGNINLRLLSVNGSGPERGGYVGTWRDSNGFNPRTIGFHTADGIDLNDEIRALNPAAHTHFNWAFSEPGVYHVNLEAYGQLNQNTVPDPERPLPAGFFVVGTPTSHQFTITFQIPHDGILSNLNASLAFADDEWELVCRDLEASVTYAEQHCYLYTNTFTSNLDTPGWIAPFTFSLDNPTTLDTVGIEAAFAESSPNSPGGVSLQLVEHVGPGDVIAFNNGYNPILDSRDGLDADDSFLLSDNRLEGSLLFTDTGIHHLAFIATALDADGNPTEVSHPLTLRCGANLTPDYSYAEWADSFERAYDLTAGSLADPTANFDNDGAPNQHEYLLDVMGSNPVVPDQISSFETDSEGVTRFIFMRDLHKDELTDASPALIPAFSSDLVSWENITQGNDGLALTFDEIGEDGPIGLHEIPIVTGNARSMFMERSLSNPNAPQDRAFFQLIAE